MIGLRVDSAQLEGMRALWARAPEIMGEEMLQAVTAADLFLLGELQQRLPKGAGGISGGAGLAASVFTEEQRLADSVIGMVASGLPYAEWVEVGTRPHFPPPESLHEWVRVKLGIQDEDEIAQVSYLVARKIAQVGTGGDFSWAETAEYGGAEVERLMLEGVDRTLTRLGAPS
jgi:hypothetical protein